jgi:hypothetical protein
VVTFDALIPAETVDPIIFVIAFPAPDNTTDIFAADTIRPY